MRPFLIPLLLLLHPTLLQAHPHPTSAKLTLPIHGKWCGPGNGLSKLPATAACTDKLDCACKAHDLCYDRYGFGICRCDMDVVKALRGSRGVKARLVAAFFRGSPCWAPRSVPFVKVCERCFRVFGAVRCWEFPCGVGRRCELRRAVFGKKRFRKYEC